MGEQFTTRAVKLIFDQEGDAERGFQSRLARNVLPRFADVVQSTYLLRVMYDGNPAHFVALCIVTEDGADNLDLRIAVQETFAKMFRDDTSLDIIFFDEADQCRFHAFRSFFPDEETTG